MKNTGATIRSEHNSKARNRSTRAKHEHIIKRDRYTERNNCAEYVANYNLYGMDTELEELPEYEQYVSRYEEDYNGD
jgi:hypothetical protein